VPARVFLLLILTPLLACTERSAAVSGNCLEVVLTGTQGGPPAVNGLAGAGTLVRYGTTGTSCADVVMQFDVGRSTTESLSQVGVSTRDVDAVFLTHLHSDHTEGLASLLLLRWHYLGEVLDIICSDDVESAAGHTLSCRDYTVHIADAMIASGEIAQRIAENNKRHADGPAGLVELRTVGLPLPSEPGAVVWESGDVVVMAIATSHIAGSLAYRVDTPAGSVVIGGDAGSSTPVSERESSTSEAVEILAAGADILVHSVIHPVFGPGNGSNFPAVAYLRQSSVGDLGAMAERAGVAQLLLTHLIPALNIASHGPFAVPGQPLTAADFEAQLRASGYKGEVHVGRDLLTIRLD